LNDCETRNHVWAERFDRPAAELFAIQDEVVQTIVGTLAGRVQMTEVERLRHKPPSSLAAYDLTLRGNALSWDDPKSAAEAKRAFERAIEIDPGYALPHSLLAIILSHEWEDDLMAPLGGLDRAFALARRAVELTDNESTCHMTLGNIYLQRRSFDLALNHMQRGLEINPNNQWHKADFGWLLSYIGRAEEALEVMRSARRVDPFFGPPWYWRGLGLAQFVLGRYADALADFDRAPTNHRPQVLVLMAACCAKLGMASRAQELVGQYLVWKPEGTIEKVATKLPFRDAQDREHLIECLRHAGMPDR
jgi:tetratricopeptide (TPR) repeat protein